jgi:UDP-GlcNAc:undecaprenyl-phosphate GlcNAc-1-phosphate transferase
MTHLPWWAYMIVFAAPLLLTVVLTPVALNVARHFGILDVPTEKKAHQSPVPYLGGAAIVAAFSLIVMGAAIIKPPDSGLLNLAAILGMALALAAMGVVDDIRTLNPWLRLGVEILAGLGAWAIGFRVDLLPGPLDLVATVLWVVVVTNAFNLLDNMDGLSAGVAAIAAGFLFVVAFLNGQFLVASLALALAGCTLGFLRHNFYPAQIYMGDAGSLYLGFLMAVLSLRLRAHADLRLSVFVPLLVLGVPLFDTTLVVVCRLRHGRNPMQGGQDHVSHRLVRLGVPVPAAVSLIYVAGLVAGWLGLIDMRIDRASGLMLVGLALVVVFFLGILLALVPVYRVASPADQAQLALDLTDKVQPLTEPSPVVAGGIATPSFEDGTFEAISTMVSARFGRPPALSGPNVQFEARRPPRREARSDSAGINARVRRVFRWPAPPRPARRAGPAPRAEGAAPKGSTFPG